MTREKGKGKMERGRGFVLERQKTTSGYMGDGRGP